MNLSRGKSSLLILCRISIYCLEIVFWKLSFYTLFFCEIKINVLHMCFDKFLFWVESRDLSQADNSIIRVSSFPSWVMGSRTFFSVSTTEPWTFCKMNALNPLKFTSHKKNWENWGKKLKLIKTSILPNFQVPNSFFL